MEADSATGTSATEISAEDTTNSSKLPGSAMFSMSWPAPSPPMVTIM